MTANWPKEIADLEDFLGRAGLTCHRRSDRANFGNRMLCCSDANIAVHIVSDRNIWTVEIADLSSRPEDWYDAAILQDLLVRHETDVLSLPCQVEVIRSYWPKIISAFGSLEREGTHNRLAALRKERARRLLPDLHREDDDLAKGSTTVFPSGRRATMDEANLPFLFDDGEVSNEQIFVLRLPKGIREKERLLSCYAEIARFPDYFGENWDALEELLGDFSWIEQPKIQIIHEDLPLHGSDRELKTYLEILSSVAGKSAIGSRELSVYFPLKARKEIGRVLANV